MNKYTYIPNANPGVGGFVIQLGGETLCWGRTKPAARARANRILKKRVQQAFDETKKLQEQRLKEDGCL